MLTTTSDKRQLVIEVHNRLYAVYAKQIIHTFSRDAVSELVDTLLSHRTKNHNSALAYNNLLSKFGSWENVRDAPVELIEQEIKPCTWPAQKAPRLKQTLQLITGYHGALTLDFLKEMEVKTARQWLEKLPGVGPKTSAAVLAYSMIRGKALPVDSHHFRVAVRLGIIDEKIGEAKANGILESLLPANFTAEQVYDNHQVMMLHGQQVCFYHSPNCKSCVLLDICPTGQENLYGN